MVSIVTYRVRNTEHNWNKINCWLGTKSKVIFFNRIALHIHIVYIKPNKTVKKIVNGMRIDNLNLSDIYLNYLRCGTIYSHMDSSFTSKNCRI